MRVLSKSAIISPGSCTGPEAGGALTGSDCWEKQVRWTWQWKTYGDDRPGAFNFVGTLVSDDTITGKVVLVSPHDAELFHGTDYGSPLVLSREKDRRAAANIMPLFAVALCLGTSCVGSRR